MITIGIDPGIERTGVGIVEYRENKYNLIFHKLLKTSSKEKHEARLRKIFDELTAILDEYRVEYASVEKLFFAKNVKTAFAVSEVRGIILLVLEMHKIPIYEYTPLQVKQGLTGYGRGDKAQIQELVKLILNLKEIPKPDDVADGIALAILHSNMQKTMLLMKE